MRDPGLVGHWAAPCRQPAGRLGVGTQTWGPGAATATADTSRRRSGRMKCMVWIRRHDKPARKALEEVGTAPDYRVSLANERTFLAWIRTALALMAAGVAVIQFVPGLSLLRHILGFTLVGLGGIVAAIAYAHWESAERAMRLGEQLPYSAVPRIVASVLALTALGALALVTYDLIR